MVELLQKLKFEIDSIPPSNNTYMGVSGKNWNYNREKKAWLELIQKEIADSGIAIKPIDKAIVSVHYIFPDKRRRDLDNYSGKFLYDALVKCGVLTDDNYSVITSLDLSAHSEPKVKKTIIEVTEIG